MIYYLAYMCALIVWGMCLFPLLLLLIVAPIELIMHNTK